MDKINLHFQELLNSKGFPMKITEDQDAFLYKGSFQLEETHFVNINVQVTKGKERAVGQIVFENVAYCHKPQERFAWLEMINELNCESGVYYYFCLGKDNRVFMRYVTELADNLDPFFNILIQGPYLIKRVIEKLEKRFGAFVV